MSRTKLFLENIIVYGGIQAVNKLFPLLFLPFIIKLIEGPEEFGKFDMFSVFVALGSTIATLGVYDAGFRENFDKTNNYKTEIITSTITGIISVTSIIVILICLVFKEYFSLLLWGSESYTKFVFIALFTMILHSFQTVGIMPLRLKNDRIKYSIYLIGNSILYYFFTIVFLKFNPKGISLMYATAISSLILVINLFVINRKYFNITLFSFNLSKSLLKIGLPLVPVFISFWLLQSISRIQISNNLGLAAQGIYSLGYRVASISMIVQIAFTTGFSFFSFSTMNFKDQVLNRTKLLKYLLIVSTLFISTVLLFQEIIFKTFFSKQYLEAIKVFPFLLFLPLLFIMYQTIANQFTIAKKTYISAVVLLFGVLTTFFLNFILIKHYNIIGAAFGTFIGYYSILIASYFFAIKFKLIAKDNDVVVLFLIVLIEFSIIFSDIISFYIVASFAILSVSFFYKSDIFYIIKSINTVIRKS